MKAWKRWGTSLRLLLAFALMLPALAHQEKAAAQSGDTPSTVWYNITDNLDMSLLRGLYADGGTVYTLQWEQQLQDPQDPMSLTITNIISSRSASDRHWQSSTLPLGPNMVSTAFAARNGTWYVIDSEMTSFMQFGPSQLQISSDRGVTWATYGQPEISGSQPTGLINQITVDSTGAVYEYANKYVFVLGSDGTWSPIPGLPDDSEIVNTDSGPRMLDYNYSFTGIAVDGTGTLYANISKTYPLYPGGNGAKLYKYDASNQQWVSVAESPSTNMRLFNDANGSIHAIAGVGIAGETPSKKLFMVDDTGFTEEGTLDSPDLTFGFAYGGGYYYAWGLAQPSDPSVQAINTTNPNFPYTPTFKVTYDGNGSGIGSIVPTDVGSYEQGASVTVAGASGLQRAGYSFAGWNTEANGSGTAYPANGTLTMAQANVILFAQWTPNDYVVTFDAAGGTVSPGTQTKQYGATYGKGADGSASEALPTPTLDGSAFVGWYTQENGAGTRVTDATTVATASDHTLYAKWAIGAYTVTFEAAGGTVDPGTQVKKYGATYGKGPDGDVDEALPIPTRAGYAFEGWWYTPPGGAGSKVTDATPVAVAANHRLYAKWTANTYPVSFSSNEGSAVDAIQADFGTTIAAPTEPTRAGYRFVGWYKEEGLTNAWDFATDTVPLNGTTLYAKWAQLFTVSYDGNGNSGGSVPTDSQAYAAGDTVTVLGNDGNLERSGYVFSGWSTGQDVSGAVYSAGSTFTMDQADMTLYAVWASPSSDSDDSYDAPTTTTTGSLPSTGAATTAESTPSSGVEVLVNGKAETAGKATTAVTNGQQVTTIEVDEQKLAERLEAAGDHAVMTIPVHAAADTVVGELNGRMVKNMEAKQATVEIRTDKAAYTLPAKEINIDAISAQIGKQLDLQDIKVRIEIATPTAQTVQVVENAAADNGLSIVVPPVEFTVKAVYGDTTVEVEKYNAYVERTVAIPADVDPSRITTGIVVDADGTVRHVPTKVVQIDGVYYAKINSMTNSTYSVVWHPIEFADVAGHWAKEAVNDLGSRMVVQGTEDGSFQPDRDMTRAEFATILVRALGLRPETGKAPFSDVQAGDWYADDVATAASYRLISGFEDGTFRPDAKITREQAMTMLASAMQMTGLQAQQALASSSAEAQLSGFGDAGDLSAWARSSAADVLKAGIVNGRDGGKLAAQATITRAEVAVMIERLLKASDLI